MVALKQPWEGVSSSEEENITNLTDANFACMGEFKVIFEGNFSRSLKPAEFVKLFRFILNEDPTKLSRVKLVVVYQYYQGGNTLSSVYLPEQQIFFRGPRLSLFQYSFDVSGFQPFIPNT